MAGNKIKNLLKTKISFWIVLLIVVILITVAFIWIKFFSQTIYNYNLSLPKSDDSISSLGYGSQPMLSNLDYFQKVVNSLIEQKAAFLEVDLSSMQLKAYIGGRLVKTVPILAKGMAGSWWETPAGIYKIENKETKHFSSFGKVYFNWSMAFQGNFFIHGWPYYKNGQKVSSAYSGGCIRLADSDAKEIYEITVIGEPVLVFEEKLKQDNFQYQKKIPGTTAQNYLAVDIKNNFVFFEKSSREVVPAFAASKLLASLVALDYLNLEKKVSIKKEMLVSTLKPRLKVNQKISIYDLLHLLLLESSNESMKAISYQLGEDRFEKLINEKAKAIGLNNSIFENIAELENKSMSTAEDLFILSKYIYSNKSFIFKLTAGNLDYSFYDQPIFSDLENFNKINTPEFFGGEVGKSSSGKESMISVFEIQKDGNTRPISIIVLESDDAKKDTEIIFNYLKDSFF